MQPRTSLSLLALGLLASGPAHAGDDVPIYLAPVAASVRRQPEPLPRPRATPEAPAAAKPANRPAPTPPAASDRAVVRTQVGRLPQALPVMPPEPTPATGGPTTPDFAAEEAIGSQSLSLQAALYGTLTGNPDLATLRQGFPIANAPSPEAVEVARRWPTTLNPTIWIDYRPITLIPPDTFGSNSTAGGGGSGSGTGTNNSHHGFYHSGQQYLLMSYRQPVELGHQTRSRFHIARAALDQQRWTVAQAEMTALVQTYRLFQTAAYRREKLRVARELAAFNARLLQTLERRLEANQGTAADVVLARVESRAAGQAVMAAQQDYVTALTDLRNQIGLPETAAAAEPLGEFTLPNYIPPIDEQALIQSAVQGRPDVHAAMAGVRGADASVQLARGDMIPTPIIGPQWAIDEAGIQYVGLIYVTPLPIVNSGKPLLRQRQAEACRARVALQSAQQRAVAQVRAAIVKWNGATQLVNETAGLTNELAAEVAKLERLFDEGQADLTKLLQGRQRLIQLENSQLDAVWAATQAQADLLLALGAPNLINGTLAQAETDAGIGVPATTPTR
jgi:outer membrane protein TolC